MKSPAGLELELGPRSQSPSNNVSGSSTASNSPEFEFWMVSNPSLPPPHLLSAAELFSGGVLLPLHLLHQQNSSDQPPYSVPGDRTHSGILNSESESPELDRVPSVTADSAASASVLTFSKRWTDIFKKKLNENSEQREEKKDEKKKRERKNGRGGSNSAEINLNLWPFSRSKSAGNNGAGRQRMQAGAVAAANRKASSEPCSRSNSAGESKSQKWPSSLSRGGVHLGRNSPVWQVRRVGAAGRSSVAFVRNAEKPITRKVPQSHQMKPAKGGTLAGESASGCSGGGGEVRVLNLNVPVCIGHRNHLSCRSDETNDGGATNTSGVTTFSDGRDDGSGNGGGVDGDSVPVGSGVSMFNLRSFFTKKVQ
ncbi:hypothetical protein Nepgr_032104 [Nepenthes gracilis]|uniref:Uncharacterized protein n=1 Tax=Nepenthes gracilis TaxID=150966 RepID=A0AAD3TJQ0_NEPGR|nr:hypothetical protein Nepgr_032104 [Nepenthes gracilis]